MWRELTEADVQGVLNEPETTAYQSAALGGGQDALADALTTVVNQCRGYIGDNPANQLAEGLTLPERVHLSALHLIRVELLTRLDLEVSEDRRSAKRDAIRFFERVSDGRVAIESPTGATEESGAAPQVETLSSRDRIAGRNQLSGL
jgi:phage gp36-like protein